MSSLTSAAERKQREADVSAIETLGPRATAAIQASDPGLKSLNDTIDAQIMALLGQGDSIAPGDKREIEQSIRSAQASRGLGYGQSDALAELVGLDRAKEARRTSRISTASGWAAQRRAGAVDPALAILGRASSVPSATASTVGTGQSGLASSNPQVFDPFSAYGADVFNTNYNAHAAAGIAESNANAAIYASIIQSIGNIAGAAAKGGA